MKNLGGKIALPLCTIIWTGTLVYLGIENVKENKNYRQGKGEARELINQKTKLEGRVVFVDEEKIPQKIGGGITGSRVIFIEREYLRLRSNGEEYDFMVGGTTPLHEGDSVRVNYFSQENLRRIKANGTAYLFLNVPTFSNRLVHLALTSEVDGLVIGYRRIK